MRDEFEAVDPQYSTGKKDTVSTVEFAPLWPSETSGNGNLKENNYRTGAAQGKSSFILKCECRQCGFPLDMNRNDHSGGSLDGQGAGSGVTQNTGTWTYPNGTTGSEPYGEQTYSQGAGCPMCFSKNSSNTQIAVEQQRDNRNVLGF